MAARAITGYTLNPTPACAGCTGLTAAASPTTVSGLTNGTSYTFTLVATNANGNSAASSASTAAVVGIPATPAAADHHVHEHRRAGLGVLDGARPRRPARSPGTRSRPSPACGACTGLTVTGNPAATSTTVGGLTAGTSYTFTLKATNASGTSAASTASAGVVTGSPNAADERGGGGWDPRPPSGALIVTWSAPASSGVGTITSYTATSSTGSKTCTSTSTAPATPALTCTITGLTNGTSYTVTVTATNSAGTAYKSVASAASPGRLPVDDVRCADHRHGDLRREPVGDGQVDRPGRAGRDAAATDRLRRDAVHRHDGADPADVQQHGDDRDGDRPRRRLDLLVLRAGDQRQRHRDRVGEVGHRGRDRIAGVHLGPEHHVHREHRRDLQRDGNRQLGHHVQRDRFASRPGSRWAPTAPWPVPRPSGPLAATRSPSRRRTPAPTRPPRPSRSR